MLGVSTLVEGAIDVLVVLIALELLNLGAAGVGWLNSAWRLGGIVGGALAVLVLGRARNASGLVLASLVIGLPLVLLWSVPTLWWPPPGSSCSASATRSWRWRA